MFRTIWGWLFAGSVAVAVWAFIGPRLSGRKYGAMRVALFLYFAALLLVYALVSSGGLFVLGGRANFLERMLLIAPVVSPLVMLIAIFSTRWASVTMWVLFLLMHSYYSYINWPSLHGIFKALTLDWPVWTTALFLSATAMGDKRNSRDGREKGTA